MPNCFHLRPKDSQEPAVLTKIDEELCRHFEVPVDAVRWFAGWYDVIGWLIAVRWFPLGSPELRTAIDRWYPDGEDEEYRTRMHAIHDYLAERYTSDAWVEIGKR